MKRYLTCFFRELRVFLSYMLPFMFCSLFLAALTIPGYRTSRKLSWKRACFANQKTIMGALEMYDLDHNSKPGQGLLIKDKRDMQILVTKGYLRKIPKCPKPERKKYLPAWHELHAISYLSIPAGICTFSGALTNAAGKKIKQLFYPEVKIPHEYRTDSCGNIWCTIHGPVTGQCQPCGDGECQKALQNSQKNH